MECNLVLTEHFLLLKVTQQIVTLLYLMWVVVIYCLQEVIQMEVAPVMTI